MSALEVLPVQHILQAIGETLVHFIWQGVLVWLLFVSWSVLLRGKPASVRYAAACLAMLLMLSLSLVTFLRVLNAPADELTSVKAMSSGLAVGAGQADEESFEGFSEAADHSISPPIVWTTFTSTLTPARIRVATPALPWIGVIWLLGVLAFSLRTLGGLIVIRRLKSGMRTQSHEQWQEVLRQLSQRLRVSRPVRLCESALIEVPAVIGYLRPIIILPASALTGLDRQQLEALLAHELAHIRRHDYLVNLLQMVVETMFFYHPAVWWLSHQVRQERENCCDDLAVVTCGDVLTYARALAALEELRFGNVPALAVAANGGGSLFERVRRLLETPSPVSRLSFCLASLIMVAVGYFIWIGARQVGASPLQTRASAQELEKGSSPLGARPGKSGQDAAADKEIVSIRIQRASEQFVTARAEESGNWELLKTLDDETASVPQTQSRPGNKPVTTEELSKVNQSSEPPDMLNELAAAGYPNLRAEQITELQNHSVSVQFIRELKALGYNSLSVEMLIEMRDHGILPEFVQDLATLNYKQVSPRQLLDAKDHGVTPEFIRQMSYAGYASLSLDQLIQLRDHSVDARFVSELREVGYGRLTFSQLLTLRDHSVTVSFIKGLQSAGYANLDVDEVVRLRDRGLTGAFIQKAKACGFDSLSLDEMFRLYESGIVN
jgi:beta-lactamase regulating signal transducer with metallopeptidase domain